MFTIEEHVTVIRGQNGEKTRVGNAFSLTEAQKSEVASKAGVDIGDPGPLDVVARAARQLSGYEDLSSSEIADRLNETAGMEPASLTDIGIEARENGAVQGEFGEAFASEFSGYTRRFEANVEGGNYRAASMLVEEMPPGLKSQLSQDTLDAIQSVLDDRALRRVDVVAEEIGVEAPDPIDASDVDEALGR
jgi:hypothetical protein